MKIGPYTFRAARASVWIEPILADVEHGAPPVEANQVAVFLEEIRDATAAPGDIPGLAQSGDRLLVTAILIETRTTLRVDLLERVQPQADEAEGVADAFVERAERRLARYLASVTDRLPEERKIEFELPRRPGAPAPSAAPTPAPAGRAPEASPGRPVEGPGRGPEAAGGARPEATAGDAGSLTAPFPDTRPPMAPATRRPARIPTTGTVSFFAEDVRQVEPAPGEAPVIMLVGGIAAQVTSVASRDSVQLTAERGVVFLEPSADAAFAVQDIDAVGGIYLEGDVNITNADYTFRADRAYFDPKTQRAVALDAVFWTYDAERGMPLYLRAEAIRQESENQWSGENVTLANVAFAEPNFSIGASEITITRDVDPVDSIARTHVDAKGVGFRAGDSTLLTIPKAKGQLRASPLRRVEFGRVGGSYLVSTRWDLHALTGNDPPAGNRAELLLDGYIERGPAIGIDLSWRRADMAGSAFAYYIYDNGTDHLTSGDRIARHDDSRGMALLDNIWTLNDEWSVFLEGSYISDEAFVDAFFEREAETRREFTNSIYFQRIKSNSLLSLQGRGTFNDFISNEYLFQSQGYAVQRLPEFKYERIGQQLAEVFSYTADVSASNLSLVFHDKELRQTGLNTNKRANAAFKGLTPDDNLADVLSAEGYSESGVLRFDTRHELELPLRWGPVNIVPFAVGRFTVWDTDFSGFNGGDGTDEDYRLWGAVGGRVATSITRVDDSVESEFLGLHRMRHIIEPSLTIWQGASSIDPSELPIYDDDVESLADGTVFRAGVRQTWQTMRGPTHLRESVDWIILDANYVWSSDDAPIDSPFGRFIEARPELSNLGEFVHAEIAMLATDAVTYVGEMLYDIDGADLKRITTGLQIDHGYGFSTFTEFRFLDGFDSTLLSAGLRSELTRKYAMTTSVTWDFDKDRFQRFTIGVARRFQQWTLDVDVDVDNISNDVGFSVGLRPVGIANEQRSRVFTYDDAGDLVLDASPDRLRPNKLDLGPFSAR